MAPSKYSAAATSAERKKAIMRGGLYGAKDKVNRTPMKMLGPATKGPWLTAEANKRKADKKRVAATFANAAKHAKPSNTNLGKQLNAGAKAGAERMAARVKASNDATRKTEANARASSKRTSAAYRGGPMQPVDQDKMHVKPTVKKSGPKRISPVEKPKKKLGGTAKVITAAAYNRQMKMYKAGTRKRPPQKKVYKSQRAAVKAK